MAHAATVLGLPIIAGNVSLYNESEHGSIPPSPMISMLGRLEHAGKALSMRFKQKKSSLLLVGERKAECGGSIYYSMHGSLGNSLPSPDLDEFKAIGALIRELAQEACILACHDISEGGLAVAVSEMAMATQIGCRLTIESELRSDFLLFSETPGFVLEVPDSEAAQVLARFEALGIWCRTIGETCTQPVIAFNDIVSIPLETATQAWVSGLREKTT